jgi:hypothetical protein
MECNTPGSPAWCLEFVDGSSAMDSRWLIVLSRVQRIAEDDGKANGVLAGGERFCAR